MNFIRQLSSSCRLQKYDKYWKVTKYVKPIDTKVYEAGEVISRNTHVPKSRVHYPEYPYEALMFKQQNRGLYGGLQKKSSKTCSEYGNKNLRTHSPNIVKTKLYSEVLDKVFQLKVATRVLRTITKEGGLDKYLLKDKSARIKTMGKVGWRIRYDIMKKLQLNELNEGNNTPNTVYHIDNEGRKFIVGKKKLMNELYQFVKSDSYVELSFNDFLIKYNWMNIDEVIESLEKHNFDFTKFILPEQSLEAQTA
ncbi:54S ribosomal protein L24, mitochondrial [[Candida] jaroonii]|uniref:54S ribosomal protein L24, mitochondrial n=1 Tax=[Candida] jaroonii TaxID=467808 RepID=A0ACA9YFZ1_9ASCO|nr:54S ribosomal protein L24, mitochondrial [[Candida] jaroonii]